jgi:hypothetical protein
MRHQAVIAAVWAVVWPHCGFAESSLPPDFAKASGTASRPSFDEPDGSARRSGIRKVDALEVSGWADRIYRYGQRDPEVEELPMRGRPPVPDPAERQPFESR